MFRHKLPSSTAVFIGGIALFSGLVLGHSAEAAPASGEAAPAPERLPNIVLILADDLDFDELGSYAVERFPSYTAAYLKGIWPAGSDDHSNYHFPDARMHTPHLDGLARDGAAFTRFYVTSSVCTPSRYSLLTGRYAGNNSHVKRGEPYDVDWVPDLIGSEKNLARRLKARGYRTGMVGKWHNSVELDFGEPEGPSYAEGLAILRERQGFDFVDRVHLANQPPKNLEWIVEGATNFIAESRAGPFFLYVSLPVPHAQFNNKWSQSDVRETVAGRLDVAPGVQPSRKSVYERLAALGIDSRNAGPTWLDDGVGAILQKLDELELRDDTMVIFTSDHQSRGKHLPYEGARVPFLIRWPQGIEAGSRIDALSANIDLLPTLLELAGAPVQDGVDGRSLTPLLAGAVVQGWRDALLIEIGNARAVVTEQWKYIAFRPAGRRKRKIEAVRASDRPTAFRWGRFAADRRPFPHYHDSDQLYDLKADFLEQKNLIAAPEQSETVGALKQKLAELLAPMPYTFGEFKPREPESSESGSD